MTCHCNPTFVERSASPWTCPHGNTWRLGVPGDPYCWTPTIVPSVLLELLDEVQRQDGLHQYGYACTRDGVRLALCTAKDEITEAEDAWRAERCRCPDPHCGCSQWSETRKEAMQAAAVLVRLIRSLAQGALDFGEAS